ncbi:amino acid permease [Acetobacter syzygii]|uniref:amino acid permease n=1 Tax=Acetobacter syzygii TaxID=146476 RepID=UPI0015713035|nr:amino acid permease [Acetobacter syzygii]
MFDVHAAHKNLLSATHVTMISVGGIIGAGLFVGTSATISSAGPSVLISYLISGAYVWSVMMIIGQLSQQSNGKGSFVSHIARILGVRFAFVTGWSYAFLWIITAGAQVVAGGMLMHNLFGLPLWIGASLFIACSLILNLMPVRSYGRAESALSILKIVFLSLFILLGFKWFFSTPSSLLIVKQNIFQEPSFFPLGVGALFTVIPMIVQTFAGCEIAVIAASESNNSLHNIKKSVNRIPLMILLFYFGSVFVIISIFPWTQITSGQSPFLEILQYLKIPVAQDIAILVTLIAILSCLNSAKYVVSRIIREMSTLGCTPHFLISDTQNTIPVRSVILISCVEFLIFFSAMWSPSHVYTILLGSSGGIIIINYLMIALSFIFSKQNQSYSIISQKKKFTALSYFIVLSVLIIFLLMLASKNSRFDALLSIGLVSCIYVASYMLNIKPKKV